MALTIEQIQENITNGGDVRQIINQIADYVQANPGGGSPGGDSGLETVTIELDDDDIKALGGTPVQIVAAVAGKIYIPVTALLQLDTSGGTYGNVNNSQLALSVNGFWLAKTHTSTGLEEVGGIYQHTMPLVNEDGDATGLDGAALVLESPNGGAFTNGNAANTLKITVVYKEVDV